jgi:hypothetical protein
MEKFAPEFAHYWLSGQSGGSDGGKPDAPQHDTPSEEAALVELAERVSAARSVV